MNCKHCGIPLEENENFCSKCGGKAKSSLFQKNKIAIMVICGLLAICFLGGTISSKKEAAEIAKAAAIAKVAEEAAEAYRQEVIAYVDLCEGYYKQILSYSETVSQMENRSDVELLKQTIVRLENFQEELEDFTNITTPSIEFRDEHKSFSENAVDWVILEIEYVNEVIEYENSGFFSQTYKSFSNTKSNAKNKAQSYADALGICMEEILEKEAVELNT